MRLLARSCLVGSLLAAAGAVPGCATEKPVAQAPAPEPAPPPASLAKIKSELLESKAQIHATTTALVALQKSPAGNASANYNRFTEEYLKLQAKSDAIKARAADLKSEASAYYDLWNKQGEVENPDLRRQAVQQKSDAERVYRTIGSEMELARIAFNPYMTNLKDVGSYLRGNLSPASLQSISDLVTKAGSQATEINTHLDGIVGAIDSMSKATGGGMIPPAPARTAAQPAPVPPQQ